MTRMPDQIWKTARRLALLLVGAHVLLGLILVVTDASQGINDQKASFALSLVVYYLNLPTVWLLHFLRLPTGVVPVVVAGILQPSWLSPSPPCIAG
jgi:hypothetical protein